MCRLLLLRGADGEDCGCGDGKRTKYKRFSTTEID